MYQVMVVGSSPMQSKLCFAACFFNTVVGSKVRQTVFTEQTLTTKEAKDRPTHYVGAQLHFPVDTVPGFARLNVTSSRRLMESV